jgi:hypothetical protein
LKTELNGNDISWKRAFLHYAAREMAGLADKGRLLRFILLHGNTTNSLFIAFRDGIREIWRFVIESSLRVCGLL